MWRGSLVLVALVAGVILVLKVHAQPSCLCQCHALLWSPVQQTDSNMTEWHDTLAAEVAANDQSSASHVRPNVVLSLYVELHTLVQFTPQAGQA